MNRGEWEILLAWAGCDDAPACAFPTFGEGTHFRAAFCCRIISA